MSDIDLWVIMDGGHIANVMTNPRQYSSQIGKPILFVYAPQNAPNGGAYQMKCYDAPIAPHIVDWYWQPKSRTYIPGQVKLLFDRTSLPHKNEPIRYSNRPADKELLERPIHSISFF